MTKVLLRLISTKQSSHSKKGSKTKIKVKWREERKKWAILLLTGFGIAEASKNCLKHVFECSRGNGGAGFLKRQKEGQQHTTWNKNSETHQSKKSRFRATTPKQHTHISSWEPESGDFLETSFTQSSAECIVFSCKKCTMQSRLPVVYE